MAANSDHVHGSKHRSSKASHSKTESKLVTLFEGSMKNPSSLCAGCQPAYLDVSSSSFDALAALYSDDFVYPDSSAEVLDNVETFIARLERFGNVGRPRQIQKERSSGRN